MSRGSGSCGGRSARRVPVGMLPPADAGRAARTRCTRTLRLSHVSLVPGPARAAARCCRGRRAAGDAPGRAPGRRVDPAALVVARHGGRLAGRPDVRPVGDGLRRDGAAGRGGRGRPGNGRLPAPRRDADDPRPGSGRRRRDPRRGAVAEHRLPRSAGPGPAHARRDRRPRPPGRGRPPHRRRSTNGPDRPRRGEHRAGGGRGGARGPPRRRGGRRRRPSGRPPGVTSRSRPSCCARAQPIPGADALAAHVRAQLAGFKVPVAFTRLDALPRTGGGKLRRDAVRAFLAGERAGILARPDGDAIGWRVTGAGSRHVVLLHGTLSTAAQLDRLAAALAEPGDLTVHALDRRGSGSSRLAHPRAARRAGPRRRPCRVPRCARDRACRARRRELRRGARAGDRRPPPGPRRGSRRVRAPVRRRRGRRTRSRGSGASPRTRRGRTRTRGPGAAAETFLRAVAGDAAWERLPDRARAYLAREGDGALADSGLTGLDPDGLARIAAPVTILTGGASEPFYAPIADELARRIPGARRRTLDGADPSPRPSPSPGPWPPPSGPAWSRPHDRRLPPDHTPTGRLDRRRQRRRAARGPGDVRPDRRPLRPDEPADLGVPGAALAPAPRSRRRASSRAVPRSTSRRGTGKVAADLHERVLAVRPRARRRPLAGDDRRRAASGTGGRHGLDYVVGDALALPTEDATFDAATIAFGMRNLPDYRRGLRGDAPLGAAGRHGPVPRDRPTPIAARPVHALVVRPHRAGHRHGWRARATRTATSCAASRAYPSPERIAEIMGEAGLSTSPGRV